MNSVSWRIDKFGHLALISVLKDGKNEFYKLKKLEHQWQ